MIDRNISVHLQDFPNLSYLNDEQKLVADMDLVRDVCSTILSIRDNKNLRVRLPLKELTVIGKNAQRILEFRDIICDEVNVKNIKIEEDIAKFGDLKLQINFKKIGAKFGPKIKLITNAIKNGNWQKIADNQIIINLEDEKIELFDDDFEIKLLSKNNDEKKQVIAPLPSNDYLVNLNIELTQELEDEGIARDIVRAVQQNRKDANLDISNHIKLQLFSSNNHIIKVAKDFENYIKEQVLADEIIYLENSNSSMFENKLEDGVLFIELLY